MSITKAQKLLSDEVLASIGLDKSGVVTAPVTVMDNAALKFIQEAQSVINKKGKVSKGNLSDMEFDVEKVGKSIELSIGYPKGNPARDYYDFVNSGVNGTEKSHGAPYSFKNLKVSKDFIKALMSWKKFNVKSHVNDDQKKGKSSLQRKRKSLAEQKEDAAYAIGVSIKKKGIKPIHFMDIAAKKTFNAQFERDLQNEIGELISVSIVNEFNNGNKRT